MTFEEFFFQTPSLMLIIDDGGIIQQINHAYAEHLGYRREALEGLVHYESLIHPEDLDRVRFFHRLRTKERFAPESYPFRYRDGSGRYHWMKTHVTRDPAKKVRVAILQPLFEEGSHRAAFVDDLIFHHAQVMMWLVDPQTSRITDVNDATLKTLGLGRGDLVECKLSEILTFSEVDEAHFFKEVKGEMLATCKVAYKKRALRVTGSPLDVNKEKRILLLVEDVTSLEQLKNQLEERLLQTVETLAHIVEMRDPYTAGHQKKVAALARSIAEEMGLEARRCETVYMAGLLHDIGKIKMPAEIMSKPGKLSELEFALIKEHSEVGESILAAIDFQEPVATIVRQHHERLDGSGYPDGLSGDQISLEARILGVADVLEAMSAHRPYRPALGVALALEELRKNEGKLYDGEVVQKVQHLFQRGMLAL